MLKTMIKSRYKIIAINSIETERVISLVTDTVKELNRELKEAKSAPPDLESKGYELKVWDPIEGVNGNHSNYLDILRHIASDTEPNIYLLTNFHRFIDERFNLPLMITYFRNIANSDSFATCIMQGSFNLPEEISQYCGLIDIPLPTQEELLELIEHITKNNNIKITKSKCKQAAEYLTGLTKYEADLAFRTVLVQGKGKLNLNTLQKLKAEKVRKNGMIEYLAPQDTINDLGGLHAFREWAMMSAKVFNNRAEAIAKKVPVPKGMLLAGVPGTGKTLSCKILANLFNVPLLRVDVGSLFASRLGETEENTRRVLKEIEAQAPAIVMIDEAEKALSGVGSSDSTDAGTTARVIGSFLYFMQETEAPVFFAFTVNNVHALPPELERKGRIDELWFVDLPLKTEREEIIKIHMNKLKLDVKTFSLKKIVAATEGYTGAEIENVLKQAKVKGFYKESDVTTEDILEICDVTVPLSISRKEEIEALRQWGTTRARVANFIPKKSKTKNTKMVLT